MMLSNSEIATIATEFAKLDGGTQTKIRAASVLLKGGQFTGSGVIFFAAQQGPAYVITAKHNLYIFSNNKANFKDFTPANLTNGFTAVVQIQYQLDANAKPQRSAAIQAVSFMEGADQTWDNDIMVRSSNDANFITYVGNNAIITPNNIPLYTKKFNSLLAKKTYSYLQAGYGQNFDPDILGVKQKDSPANLGKFQCRFADPQSDTIVEHVYETSKEKNKYVARRTFSNALLLSAKNANSSGEGDSGGPLFAIAQKSTKDLYLIGITTGANLVTGPNVEPLPDTGIKNNVVTCVNLLIKEWQQQITQ
jgi:hypothetical protein